MRKNKREKPEKACDDCGDKNHDTLFRVRGSKQESWLFLCSECKDTLKKEAAYEYGGTWKQRKRN